MTPRRAYSILKLKAVGEGDERELAGIASTPTPDREEDILDPKGALFKLPIPLLWQHRASEPIGEVYAARVTDEGIEIKARLAKVDEPGRLKDRLDEAWQSLKAGLVRGLSVGWIPLEYAAIQGTYGIHAFSWEWLELSAVTVPANAEATITAVKSCDAEGLAASGRRTASRPSTTTNTPGAAGKAVRLLPTRQESHMKTLTEQLTHYKSTRDAKYAERQALMTKATEEGRTLDQAEEQAYDALDVEIKALDRHIRRLETELETEQKAAKPVAGGDPQAAAAARSAGQTPSVRVRANEEKGIGFARAILCKTAAFLSHGGASPLEIAKARFPDHDRLHAFLSKAAIPAGTTSGVTWAAPLVDETNLTSEFIEFLRPMTLLGRIPGLRRVPFNIRVPKQTSGGDAYWVGEGAPKPVTKFDFGSVSLGHHKVASIAVITKELARFSQPSAEQIVRDALAAAVAERIDVDFIDPSHAAVSGVNPASVTNGLTALAPSGTSADAARSDVARIVKQYLDNNNRAAGLVLLMPDALALSLSIMRNSLGQREFPDMTLNGGSLEGIPVLTSQYLANRSGAGNLVVAVNARDIMLADDGNITVDVSTEASLQMLDNPTNSAASATATSMVSLWQTNSIGLLAEREITWAKARAEAVVYMDDVNWGSIGSPA